MRKTLDKFLARVNNPDVYLLHADMWHFTEYSNIAPSNVIDFGIQEPTVVNFASGLAWCGKTVFIYGVAGMILHRAYEQIKLNIKGWAEHKGNIIFVNAGHTGCYIDVGRGHLIDDDILLCQALKIPVHTPTTKSEFLMHVKNSLRAKSGANFIRFGADDCKWK